MPGSQVRYAADYGTIVVEASDTATTFKFWLIAGGGNLIDSYTIGLPNSVMLAPSDLASNDSTIHEEQTSDDSELFEFSPVADRLGPSRSLISKIGLASKNTDLASATNSSGKNHAASPILVPAKSVDDDLIEITPRVRVFVRIAER